MLGQPSRYLNLRPPIEESKLQPLHYPLGDSCVHPIPRENSLTFNSLFSSNDKGSEEILSLDEDTFVNFVLSTQLNNEEITV